MRLFFRKRDNSHSLVEIHKVSGVTENIRALLQSQVLDPKPEVTKGNGISSDDTKYSALVANLDAETLFYVSGIVLSPPNSDKYHTLSQRLITQFSDSETQKIKKLLTDLQLGDEKPSHLLRKMRAV
ncbi:uncharacterized protein TNCV_1603151 [Trichonephila clavipes]|nr:uncharacterized protein TNCV_1603151 [Trichonephila clavipes]